METERPKRKGGFATGGKPNSVKPTEFLRAARHVSKRPEEEDTDELQRELRLVKAENRAEFLRMLAKAEHEQKRARIDARKIAQRDGALAEQNGPSIMATSAAPGLADEACVALLEELLQKKGWVEA